MASQPNTLQVTVAVAEKLDAFVTTQRQLVDLNKKLVESKTHMRELGHGCRVYEPTLSRLRHQRLMRS